MKRREFITGLAVAGLSGRIAWARARGLSILQGMTDATTSQFTVLAPRGRPFRFEIEPFASVTSETVGRPFSDFEVHKLRVEGLSLGTRYILRVYEGQAVVEEREFGALDLSPRAVKAAFLSCQLDFLHNAGCWRALDAADPEILFFLGDNVYADRTSLISKKPADPRQLWERYVQTRQSVDFYFQKRLRPVIAIWDDHDFGGDNLGREYPYAAESREVFETFFAQTDNEALTMGPGIARRFTAFGADFFLLDCRTFRDKRMLGEEQTDWLASHIRPRATWLLSGSQFFGGYTRQDSFEQLSADFTSFKEMLRAREGLYCLASGDVHFSEVMDIEAAQLGHPTFELVASSIHSFTVPFADKRFHNPRRRVSTASHNFVIFEGEFGEDRVEGMISCYADGRVAYRVEALASR